MARKILIDCDPGIGDAVALAIALFDPRLDVVAITGTEGAATADCVNRNIQAIIDQLDPPRFPRLGVAHAIGAPVGGTEFCLDGSDGLGNSDFRVSQLHHRHPAEKVIHDVVRLHPEQLTILCLGPLTNLAKALKKEPQLANEIGQVVMVGGAIHGKGDASAAAEFNMFYDPEAARSVFQSRMTKSLVPREVTTQVTLSMDFLQQLPTEDTKGSRFLESILPFFFRAHQQHLGLEGIRLNGVIALLYVLHPELFQTTGMFGDVETQGELTRGVTVFDRRSWCNELPNMEVATSVDKAAAIDCILRGIRQAVVS